MLKNEQEEMKNANEEVSDEQRLELVDQARKRYKDYKKECIAALNKKQKQSEHKWKGV